MSNQRETDENTIREWITSELSNYPGCENFPFTDPKVSLQELLCSGEVLCHLINKLAGGQDIKLIHTSKLPFKQMENIKHYLDCCTNIKGFNPSNVFPTVDLFEGRGMDSVLRNLRHLKLLVQKNNGNLYNIYESKNINIMASPSRNAALDATYKKPLSFIGSHNTAASTQPSVASLHDDIKKKEEFKFSREMETLATQWVRNYLLHNKANLSMHYTILEDDSISLAQLLQSGELLCEMANIIFAQMNPNPAVPGSPLISKINHSKIAYLCMENIGHYLTGCATLGIQSTDLFDTTDLYEKKNMNLVITHIHVVARWAEKTIRNYSGPIIEDTSQVKTLYSQAMTDFVEELDSPPPTSFEQKEILTWLNEQMLRVYPDFTPIKALGAPLRSGVVLAKLVAALTRQKELLTHIQTHPSILLHCMENASVIHNYITQQTFHSFEDCTSQDIVLGDPERIYKLLVFLRDKFDLDYLFLKVMNEDISPDDIPLCYSDLDFEDVSLSDPLLFTDDSDISPLSSPVPTHNNAAPAIVVTEIETPEVSQVSPHSHSKSSTNSLDIVDDDNDDDESPATPRRKKKHSSSSSSSKRRHSLSATLQEGAEKVSKHRHHRHSSSSSSSSKRSSHSKSPRSSDSTILPPSLSDPNTSSSSSSSVSKSSSKKRRALAATDVEGGLPSGDSSPVDSFRKKKSSRSSEGGSTISKHSRRSKKEGSTISQTEDNTPKFPKILSPREHSKKARTAADIVDEVSVPKEKKVTISATTLQVRKELSPRGASNENLERKDQGKKLLHPLLAQQSRSISIKCLRRELSTANAAVQQERVRKAQLAVRKRIIDELVDTEKNYVQGLACVVQLLTSIRKDEIISQASQKAIFANIEEIHSFHERLSKCLTDFTANYDEKNAIGNLFKKNADFFTIYEPYLENYSNSLLSAYAAKYRVDRFAQALDAWEHSPQVVLNSITSYLVMPVQRLPRYILLFKDLIKYTPPDHDDATQLTDALNHIAQQLHDIHKNMDNAHADSCSKLISVAESIDSDSVRQLVQPGKKFLKEGKLKVQLKSKTNFTSALHRSRPYSFLFNDFLICCEQLEQPKANKQFDLKEIIMLNDVTLLTEIPDGLHLHRASDTTHPWVVKFKYIENPKEKEEWTKVLYSICNKM